MGEMRKKKIEMCDVKENTERNKKNKWKWNEKKRKEKWGKNISLLVYLRWNEKKKIEMCDSRKYREK